MVVIYVILSDIHLEGLRIITVNLRIASKFRFLVRDPF